MAEKKKAKKAAKKGSKKSAKAATGSKGPKKPVTKKLRKGEYEMKNLEIGCIKLISSFNPRSNLGDMKELKANVRENGILQSLVVRPSKKEGKYDLIVGGRRYAIALELKLRTLPVIVRTDLTDDARALAFAVSENSGDVRTQLTPMDQAKAFKKIMDSSKKKISPRAVGKMCGCYENKVKIMLRLLDAPKALQARLEKGDIKTSAAVALTEMTPSVQNKVLSEIEPGMTEAQVVRLGNAAAVNLGVATSDKSKKGKLAGSSSGALVMVRSRKEMRLKAEDLVVEILNGEDDGKDMNNQRFALAAIFWYFGTVEKIDPSNKGFSKEFKAIEKKTALVEVDEGE